VSLRRVPVSLPVGGYEVTVGPGARASLATAVRDAASSRHPTVAVVTQEPLVGLGWFGEIDPGAAHAVLTVGEGERAKSLATVERLCRGFVERGLGRGDVVVAVGGGLVTDVAGLAASLFCRGVAVVHVPTTLLGQIDAAVGGKTGANLPEGKNLVGTFWQPAAVLCDTELLATLPERELACGRGELAKYALLGVGDGALWEASTAEQVARCVAYKASVVEADERDQGGRALLNYGHTLAHALEGAVLGAGSDWDLRHGEAVAIGLVFAAELACAMGRVERARVDAHRVAVARFGLSATLPAGARAGELVEIMARDKKSDHDLTFVLDGPRGIEVVHGVDPAVVVATLQAMGAAP